MGSGPSKVEIVEAAGELSHSLSSSGGDSTPHQDTDEPEACLHDQPPTVRDDHLDDIQWSHLCARCKNLKVHGPTSEFSSASQRITVGKLEDGLNVGCSLCKMMIKSFHSTNNAFFVPEIKPDSANSGLQHLETYTSASGHFVFSAEEGDPAADILPRRPPLTDYKSEAAYALIRGWISICSNSHVECEPPCPKLLPRRLIDVGSATQDPFLVVLDPGTLGLYVALSYCWGLHQPMTLKTAMLKDRLPSFPIQQLPATLRDAMLICRELGFQYIWIDALCIIQDSPNGADWMIESGMMDTVYGNAAITIAASAAKDSSEGMLHKFPVARHLEMCTAPYRLEDGRVGKVYIHFHPYEISSHQPIAKRAWTFQESLLSPRLLSYGTNQLAWKCKQGTLCANTLASDSVDTRILDSLKWKNIVSEFTSRNLTVSSDRLAALSGYAKSVFLKSKSSPMAETQLGSSYLAGLWSHNILHDLLWKSVFPWKYRPAAYRAPTWSWASIDSSVHFIDRGPTLHSNIEILNFSVAVSEYDPFGSLQPSPPSYIKLRGHVKSAAGLSVQFSRTQQFPPSELTIDCYQGPAGLSQGHNLFSVIFDTLETAERIVFYLEKQQNTDAIFFSRACPLWFLKLTDTQALIVAPTVHEELERTEHIFVRVGILIAIYTTLGSFGTWYDDVEEPTIITLL